MSTPSDLITCQDIPKMKLGTKTTTKCLVEIACPQLVGLLSVKNSWSSSMMIGFIPTMLDGLMPQSKWIRLALPWSKFGFSVIWIPYLGAFFVNEKNHFNLGENNVLWCTIKTVCFFFITDVFLKVELCALFFIKDYGWNLEGCHVGTKTSEDFWAGNPFLLGHSLEFIVADNHRALGLVLQIMFLDIFPYGLQGFVPIQ